AETAEPMRSTASDLRPKQAGHDRGGERRERHEKIELLYRHGEPSTFKLVEVLDVDRADVAEKKHQDREPDRRLGGGDGQYEENEHLSRHVVEEARERDEIEVDGEQHQLDRHQQDDHVPAIEKDAGHADG